MTLKLQNYGYFATWFAPAAQESPNKQIKNALCGGSSTANGNQIAKTKTFKFRKNKTKKHYVLRYSRQEKNKIACGVITFLI